jgi:hypothetical protein
MPTSKVNAAKASAATVACIDNPDTLVAYSRTNAIKSLAEANAQQRVLILSALPMGEVAAIGGIVSTVAASVNEVLAMKMADKHGTDWVAIAKALPADLSDADKTRRKQINESLEGIRSTIQANSGGDKDKARNILHRVKEWGAGKRTNKASNPKANTKRALREFLLSWDVMPSTYRRIMKDEGANENDMVLADAIAAYFTANNIKPRAVLDCTGEAAWKVS